MTAMGVGRGKGQGEQTESEKDIFHISSLLGIRRMSNGLEIRVGVRFKKERD